VSLVGDCLPSRAAESLFADERRTSCAEGDASGPTHISTAHVFIARRESSGTTATHGEHASGVTQFGVDRDRPSSISHGEAVNHANASLPLGGLSFNSSVAASLVTFVPRRSGPGGS
jgi:hypothetical protein